jgi:hypothetical protein
MSLDRPPLPAKYAAAKANPPNQATGGKFAALIPTNNQTPTRLPATFTE